MSCSVEVTNKPRHRGRPCATARSPASAVHCSAKIFSAQRIQTTGVASGLLPVVCAAFSSTFTEMFSVDSVSRQRGPVAQSLQRRASGAVQRAAYVVTEILGSGPVLNAGSSPVASFTSQQHQWRKRRNMDVRMSSLVHQQLGRATGTGSLGWRGRMRSGGLTSIKRTVAGYNVSPSAFAGKQFITAAGDVSPEMVADRLSNTQIPV